MSNTDKAVAVVLGLCAAVIFYAAYILVAMICINHVILTFTPYSIHVGYFDTFAIMVVIGLFKSSFSVSKFGGKKSNER